MTTIPLKRLSLQGYKSFARKTEFPFEHHITAIVGPNGSGKSNLADAVRWALGEQSYTTLRGQRTEDMIFHGSDGHRRLGMAQVSLTFDNQEGWLPIDFSEVTISRHADRSGANQYLINGSRVRLRDIVDLLTQSGISHHPYTIIGQGLVDRVLTLHSQERRTLVEEAAGIVGYQTRRGDVIQQLQETEHNLTRVKDIISEIEPRLARLAQQADRAQEHARLSQELEEALMIWYGYQWHTGKERLTTARSRAQHQTEHLSRMTSELQATQQEMAECEAQHQQLRAQEAAIRTKREDLDRTLVQLDHRQTILQERRQLLEQRQAEIAEERVALQEQQAAQALRTAETESVVTQLEAQCRKHQAEIDQLSAEHTRLNQARVQLQTRVQSLRREAGKLIQAQARRQAELDYLQQRQAQLLKVRSIAQKALQRHQEEATTLEERHQASIHGQRALTARQSTLDAQLQALARERQQLQQSLEELRHARSTLEQRVARLAERRELLTRMRSQQYQPGTQTVQRAVAQGRFPTSTTVVAELLKVQSHLQSAIQAALDNRLQDLVVEDQATAQRILAFLQQIEGGRVTLWPLDSLRAPNPVEVPQARGVVGRASDMVSVAGRPQQLAECLLSRTLIVEDVDTAHRLLPALDEGCQLVTLNGEVVRSEGALGGGSILKPQTGPLAREEEWRQLASAEKELSIRLGDLARDEQVRATRCDSHQERTARLEADMQQLRAALEQQAAEARAADEALQESHRAIAWERRKLAEAEGELSSLAKQQGQVEEGLARLETQAAKVQAALSKAEDQERAATTLEVEDQRLRLERARTNLAVGQEALLQRRERLREADVRRQHVARQLQRLNSHQKEIDENLASCQSEIEELILDKERCKCDLDQLTETCRPIQERLEALQSHQQTLGRTEHDLQLRKREAERQAEEAQLGVDRLRDELLRLARHISEDLGLTDIQDREIADPRHQGQDMASQPPLPLEYAGTSLPEVTQAPEGLRDSIRLLRSRLRRLGRVNHEAPTEHAELKRRHDFLTDQASDLEDAACSLRQIIDELDRTIQCRFLNTFQTVSDQFARYFSMLFEGGEAQLALSEPDDVARTGIDIHVRPPGKRPTRLELLSGGERALTTIALIFAVLAASPTPFCLLDEVDATLDEANSQRLRHLLEQLAEHTQFIIITHNREIVEAADTIYGLSMDDGGVSQAISLQLDEATTLVTT